MRLLEYVQAWCTLAAGCVKQALALRIAPALTKWATCTPSIAAPLSSVIVG